MGATYTRQSTISDGAVIEASHFNDEFDQILAAFAASTGHTHDGTAAEGGPISKLLSNTLTFGAGTAGTDITMTFDGETSDGVLYWMEDEDHFKFADDIVVDSTKRLYFNDEGGEYIYGDGTDLYLTSGADINIPADIGLTFGNDGEKIEGDGTDLTISGNNINLTATADVVIPNNVGIQFGGASEKIEGDGTDLTISANNLTVDAAADIILDADGANITLKDGGTTVLDFVPNGATDVTLDAPGDIKLDADGGDIFFVDGGTTFGSATNSSGNLIIKSGTTTALTFSGADATLAGDLTISGDDLTMGTNTAGMLLVADGTNFNPVAVSGDVTMASTGAITIASGSVENAMLAGSIADSKLSTISTADKVSGAAIQIDGATDGTSITVADADKFLIDDGGTTKYITASQLNTYTSGSVAADDISTGDAAITLATSSGNITIDAQAGDTDIIFKGTDSSSDITALTLDMSEAGAATFNDKVVATELDISGNMDIDGTSNLDAVDIDGTTQIDATVTVGVDDTGYDVKFFGATSGSYLLWDESADSLLLTDSTPVKIGDSQDLTLYHDGTNSYITNAVGALKIATETSGIAVTIGHTTSETTIADNATVTGNLSVGGNFDVTGTLDFSDSAITNAGDIQLDSITGDGDTDTAITFSGSNVITFKANNENQITINDGSILPSTDDNIDLGSSTYQFKDGYFDGTLEADAITVGGTNVVTAGADTSLTSIYNSSLAIGYGSSHANIDFGTDNNIIFDIDGTGQIKLQDGALLPVSDDDVDLGSSSLQFKNAYFDGTLEADAITIGGTAVTAGGASKGFAVAVAIAL